MTPTLRGLRSAAAWAVEAVATGVSGVRTLVPGAPVPASLREDVLVSVAQAREATVMAWVHGEWRAFAGSVPDGDVRLALDRHARACARAGYPVPATVLDDVLPPATVRGVRAVVVRGRLEAEVEARTRRVVGALRHRRPSRAVLVDVPLAAVGLAAAAPAMGVGAVLGTLARLAPAAPVVEGADDPEVGLLGALAAEAVTVLLANAGVRTLVLAAPVEVAVGLRSGPSAATVRVGRGRVQVTDGIAPDALVVLQGDVEPLVRLAAGVVLREALEVVPRP